MSVPAAWPQVRAALFALADASLSGVRVTNGRDTTNELGDFLMIGVASIDVGRWESTGSFDQEFQSFGGSRMETGTVNAVALSRSGSAGDDATADASTAVFALVTELAAAVRAAPALGLTFPEPGYLVAQVKTGGITESSNTEATMATIALAIQYQARI